MTMEKQTDIADDGPEDWLSEKGLRVALEHGYTEEQYRAAKTIEFKIFGPYEWQNQGDRAATMMVAICDAIRAAVQAQKEKDAAIANRIGHEMEYGHADPIVVAESIADAIERG